MKTALTIAGSDCSGGAGIQADIKTMTAHGVYAMSAVTALTAQNTTGVKAIMEVREEFLAAQLDAVFTDIFPDAVKIGMISSRGLIQVIGEKLKKYKAINVVIDPVMVSTSGSRLMSDDAIDAVKEELFPLADLLTPNIPEAEVLSGMRIRTKEDMEKAAKLIGDRCRCAVLCKGGHQQRDADDLLYQDGSFWWFYGKRIDTFNTHGTGCTLSSAIASNLAKGQELHQAVEEAKFYLSLSLEAKLDLGKGNGPMNHAFDIRGEFRGPDKRP
ncbi:bifunctional hydroxymethylpyrimidine kinase/phosphomethylpyrimidine kinase [Lachnospiraceae bacterium 62-35]